MEQIYGMIPQMIKTVADDVTNAVQFFSGNGAALARNPQTISSRGDLIDRIAAYVDQQNGVKTQPQQQAAPQEREEEPTMSMNGNFPEEDPWSKALAEDRFLRMMGLNGEFSNDPYLKAQWLSTMTR